MKVKVLFILFLLFSGSSFAQNGFSLRIDAVKIGYDTKRNLIYAITSGKESIYGNSLVAINLDGQVVKSIFVGSEPNNFVFTSDSNYMFISFSELAKIKRVDLSTFLVDQQFGVGSSDYYGDYFGASLATLPGENNLVIVSRTRKNVSPTFGGLAVFKNGIELPKSTPGHTGPEYICSTGKDTIFGQGSSTLYTIYINKDSGAYILSSRASSYLPGMQYDSGFLYGINGYVMDARSTPPSQYGRVQIADQQGYQTYGLCSDAFKGKIFSVEISTNSSKLVFKSFDINTLLKKNSFEVPFQLPQGFNSPMPKSLIRVGNYGLATIINEDYFFGTNRGYIVLANNLSFVDSNVVFEPAQPRTIWYDTVVVNVYDTIKLQTNDTLAFPMFIQTGMEDELLATFKFFPNPTRDYLFIEVQSGHPNSLVFDLTLSDLTGKVVASTQFDNWGGYLYVGNLTKGTYVLKISHPDSGEQVYKKIVVY